MEADGLWKKLHAAQWKRVFTSWESLFTHQNKGVKSSILVTCVGVDVC